MYYQHWQEHQNSCCEVGRDTEKGHCSLRWLHKVQQTGRHSKETEINRFLLWDTTDKEGEATSWPNEKHVFSDENLSKLCTEGAIQNLLNMLHFLPVDIILGGELATSDLFTLMKSLNESLVPRAVLSPSLGIDSIQKCLWILPKKPEYLIFPYSYSPIICFTKVDCIPSSRISHFIVGFWGMSWHTNLTWNVSHNIFDNIAFILMYSKLFCKFIWLPLCFFCMIFHNSLQCLFPYVAWKIICWSKLQHVMWHFSKGMHFG